MHPKSYTGLLAVMLLLVAIPFAPALIEHSVSTSQALAEANTAPSTNPSIVPSISSFTAAGYVGQYGPPDQPSGGTDPRVLGVSTTRTSAAPPANQAREVGKSNGTITFNPGQATTVWVDFLNTGRTTWRSDGTAATVLRLAGAANRASPFRHQFWKTASQPGRLIQREVKPGQVGRFRFALHAPATAGQYLEEFQVYTGSAAVDGGYTQLPIGVGQAANRPAVYQATEVQRSHGGTLVLRPGQAMTFWIDFKNTGLKTWYNTGSEFIALNVADPAGHVSLFQHDYWKEYYYRPARLLQPRVYPGQVGRFRFALQAPNVAGYYTETFGVVAEHHSWVTGGKFSISFKVGQPPQPVPAPTAAAGEPTVRIGLYSTDQPVTATVNGSYQVINGLTNEAVTKTAGEVTTVPFTATSYTRVVPSAADGIVTVTSYTNKPSWNSTLNDNTFRGTVEVRTADSGTAQWVINELPLESYLRGLAEVTNGQPDEYLKALITSARSYALWHQLRGGKHPTEHFDINANTDQVYRGYGFEQRSVDPLAAVIATAGMVVTHPDAISTVNPAGVIITPYSSGTDGRTRSWQEVWNGGGYPWCLSVADPYGAIPNYATLSGNHMVGLSATGARGYAAQEGKTFDWILKYYYTGTSVVKLY
ncbi:MAG: SpoIID/LytB domain-containing protein [Patescibacteria group bacterium]